MGFRRSTVVLALAMLVATAVPSATQAYHFHALKWPGGVIPYYNAAPDQAWAVTRAVSAWNHSGARIRFVAVPRAAAGLVIEEETGKVYCAEGHATLGHVPGARVVIFPAHGITHACNRFWAVRVITHELGHVLGLLHEDRACAAMNAVGSLHGGRECEPKSLWDWRCRLLEPDDLAGVVAAYGGAARAASQPELCPLYPAIARPPGLAAEYVPSAGAVRLSFRRPAEPAIPAFVVPSPWSSRSSFGVSGPLQSCARNEAAPTGHWRWHVHPLAAQETFETPAVPGRRCYAVWAFDELGRPSGSSSTVFVSVK
jgi:hypothetical protein